MQATLGYMFSAWTNVVKTEDWIDGVQTNDFRDMGDTMTFDGLVARRSRAEFQSALRGTRGSEP